MDKSMKDYTIVIRLEFTATFAAYVPAIEGCHAWGKTPDEARAELAHVFDMIADEHLEQGRPLPLDVELKIARAG